MLSIHFMNALDWFHDTIYIVQFICDREYDLTVFEFTFFSNASYSDVNRILGLCHLFQKQLSLVFESNYQIRRFWTYSSDK